jgi:hypothetical protein
MSGDLGQSVLCVSDTRMSPFPDDLRQEQRAMHLSALRTLGLVPMVDSSGALMTPLNDTDPPKS